MVPEGFDQEFRYPTESELSLLLRLASADVEGAAGIRRQIESVLVKSIDDDGSVKLKPPEAFPAQVKWRVPVEATYRDADGVTVHILLHVVDELVDEVEIFREDSGTVLTRATDAGDLTFLP